MCAHVLVVEDDEKQAEVVRRYLVHEGHTVTVAHDGHTAIEHARARLPQLLVLDLMLPGLDGLHVCRMLRREFDRLPVLMLTARSTEEDLLLGLDIGADDYMTKPYSPRELMARIRSLLRRAAPVAPENDVLGVGALTVDPKRYEVRYDGKPVSCTPGEFALLAVMAEQPERVFTRSQLLAMTRGSDRYISDRVVDVHIANLRRKIEPDPQHPVHLVTVFGVGYKLSSGTGHDGGRRP
ncbi:response regulator transcription factor [Streptomyces sp. NPDC094143]|uniref:response regulator transcription factor n=1 Tax=unclassified Streptomyces TaxID=2593676 RepID=UPI0033340B39